MLLYFHGGGWMVGDVGAHDVLCRMLANRGRFAVANVDYRLAPENKFPAAVEDLLGGDTMGHQRCGWIVRVDAGRIGVGGDSAGGNISAVLALMARDARLALAFQALIYPATHFSLETRVAFMIANGYLLSKRRPGLVSRGVTCGARPTVTIGGHHRRWPRVFHKCCACRLC